MTTLQPVHARTGEPYGEPLSASTPEQIDAAAEAAAACADDWAATGGDARAALLRALADTLEAHRDELVGIADIESALGPVRLNGELDRTAFQLRRFADIAASGTPFTLLDDPAVAGAPPAGHPAMARVQVPLGPVAMFSASNFPFAFSVLGGDTASALAAGCPVVVKAHPAHPRLSARTHALIEAVLSAQKLPAGLIGMVQGGDVATGVRLIRHPAIAAGAFTGSTRGGAALQAEAMSRPRPIPFYGELGSINPVLALPAALQARGDELAATLAGSIALGCGQFCTNPGVIVLIDGEGARAANDAFVHALRTALSTQTPHAMLTAGMRRAFEHGVSQWREAGAEFLVSPTTGGQAPGPVLAQVAAAQFIDNPALREEVFGPGSLIVRASSTSQVEALLKAVGGSLTVTVWGGEADTPETRTLVRAAMNIAGRVLFSGVPTGVAVCAAQQHGGPWPSSTQPGTTSVGDAALGRFLRPVALQDAPGWLLSQGGRPL